MYVMEKGVGWKERGAGMLKVNVPKSTVEFDDQGVPDPTSFDASVLEDEEDGGGPKHVRLIMRQDHTLRVILNTVILPAMKLQVTNRLKTSTVLFTAFEEGEGRQVQVKVCFLPVRLDQVWRLYANGDTAERGKRHGFFAACRDAEETARRCLGACSLATRCHRISATFVILSFVSADPKAWGRPEYYLLSRGLLGGRGVCISGKRRVV
jgi:hypothetical protein